MEADILAKEKLGPRWQGLAQYRIPFERWVCAISNRRISKQLCIRSDHTSMEFWQRGIGRKSLAFQILFGRP